MKWCQRSYVYVDRCGENERGHCHIVEEIKKGIDHFTYGTMKPQHKRKTKYFKKLISCYTKQHRSPDHVCSR